LTGRGTTLGHYVEFLYAESRRPDSLLRYGQNARPAVQTLVAMLVQSFDLPTRILPSGRSWYVKRAEAFMEENLSSPIGICDVVASSGISLRTLYHGFHTCHGVAPMTWLKQRRLSKVHDELRLADPGAVNGNAMGLLPFGPFCRRLSRPLRFITLTNPSSPLNQPLP
jgi:hypothetical protein